MFARLFSFAQFLAWIHNSFTIFLRDKSNLPREFSAQLASAIAFFSPVRIDIRAGRFILATRLFHNILRIIVNYPLQIVVQSGWQKR
jgi:hypothetical protein